MQQRASTAYANANIALVKYWGKQDRTVNIPAVPSLSMTLRDFGTTVTISEAPQHCVFIDGKLGPPDVEERVVSFIEQIRLLNPFAGCLKISSKSSIPFAAGLASSAAFYAALATALNHHFAWDLSPKTVSTLARMGSASAARSIFSSFAGLYGGPHCDHDQAYGFLVESHPDLDFAMIIAVVSTKPKSISSRLAMNLTQSTSPFFKTFVETQNDDFNNAITALKNGSFESLGSIMEHSTLKMFATMWTAQPAINYWHINSLHLVNLVYEIRQELGHIVYFTLDAGPQVKIITLKKHAEIIMTRVKGSGLAHHVYCSGPGEGAKIMENENDSHDN